jgi:hypothetical protein
VCALGFSLLLAATACNSDSSSSNTTAPAPTVTETLSGVVPAPVGGVAQSSFISFNSAGAGTGSVTLTSAIETLSNGSLFPGVTVNLQLGTPSAGNCTVASGSGIVSVVAGPSPLSAPFVAGANCILVTSGDQSATAGPVNYTIVVVHF